MLTDPIADMLTRIRNAHMALHTEVNIPRSQPLEPILIPKLRKNEGRSRYNFKAGRLY